MLLQQAASQNSWLGDVQSFTSILVDLLVIAGGIFAAIKFRLFNSFGYRWRSEVTCVHTELASGRVVFVGEYTIYNTGERPLDLQSVSLRLYNASREGPLLIPDRSSVLAERICLPSDLEKKGLFRIEAHERAIYTLRCELPVLDEVVFVICDFAPLFKRQPASFVALYVKKDRRRQAKLPGNQKGYSSLTVAQGASQGSSRQ